MALSRRALLAIAASMTAPKVAAQPNDDWDAQPEKMPDASELVHAHPEMPRIRGSSTVDLSIVEFFDYRCRFCREMQPSLDRLMAGDPKLLLLLEPWPIYGAVSEYAARIALASARQGAFREVHAALMTAELLDREAVRQAAGGAGLDLVAADRDMADRHDELDRMASLGGRTAAALGLRVTPGLLIGSKLAAGALAYQDLMDVVSSVRAGSSGRPEIPAP